MFSHESEWLFNPVSVSGQLGAEFRTHDPFPSEPWGPGPSDFSVPGCRAGGQCPSGSPSLLGNLLVFCRTVDRIVLVYINTYSGIYIGVSLAKIHACWSINLLWAKYGQHLFSEMRLFLFIICLPSALSSPHEFYNGLPWSIFHAFHFFWNNSNLSLFSLSLGEQVRLFFILIFILKHCPIYL